MATPEDNLLLAYPGASTGDAVLDEATGDYWIFNGSIWLNHGPILGQTISIGANINVWEETIIREGIVGPVLSLSSAAYSLQPTYTNYQPVTTIGLSVITTGVVLSRLSIISISAFEPTRPVGSVVYVPGPKAVTVGAFTPQVDASILKAIPVGFKVISVAANAPALNIITTQVFPGNKSISISKFTPIIDAVNDSDFQYTVFQVQSKGLPGTTAPLGRFFPDTSAKRNTVRVNEVAVRYSPQSQAYASSLSEWTNTVKGVVYSKAKSKFGTSSMLFASSSSWLQGSYDASSAFGTGPFTMEAWVYFNEFNSESFLFNNLRITSTAVFLYTSDFVGDTYLTFLHGGALQTGVWHHIAISRDGSSQTRLFVDGVQIGSSQTVTTNFVMPVYTLGARNYQQTYQDPSFSLVSLLIQPQGPSNSITFADQSPNNVTITRQPNTIQYTNITKFAPASAYFDGAGDWLQIADSANFNLSSGSFTIEAWVYPTSLASSGTIIQKGTWGQNYSWSLRISSTAVLTSTANISGDYDFVSPYAFTTNTWYHVALIGNGTSMYHYVNGVLIGTKNRTLTNASSPITIGVSNYNNYSESFAGYIGGLRVTRAQRWTAGAATFELPTAQWPTASGVQPPARCRLRAFVQEARVYKGLAKYTGPYAVPTSPFVGYYVQPPLDSEASIPDSSIQLLIPGASTPGGSVPKDYSSNNYAITASTGSRPNPLTDPYWDNVSYLLQFEGTEGSTTITEKKFGYTTTVIGAVYNSERYIYQTRSKTKFNEFSLLVDGPQYNQQPIIRLGVPDGLRISTTDTATIEAWIWVTDTGFSTNARFLLHSGPSNNAFSGYTNNTNYSIRVEPNLRRLGIIAGTTQIYSSTNSLKEKSWNHVAVTSSPTTGIRIYTNGQYVGGNSSVRFNDTNYSGMGVTLGNMAYDFTSSYAYWGFISELRVTKGVARYTGVSYEVPTAKFPTQSGTTTPGTAKTVTATDPFGGKSKVIEISRGGRLAIASSQGLIFNKQPFCVEFWMYLFDHPESSTSSSIGFCPLDGPADTSPKLLVEWDNSSNNIYEVTFGKVKGHRLFVDKAFATFGCPIVLDKWHHVAYTRDSLGEVRVFIDGVMQESPQFLAQVDTDYKWTLDGYKDFTTALDTINSNPNYDGNLQRTMNGYICDIRVTKGYARYLANFDVPTQRLSGIVPSKGVGVVTTASTITLSAFAPLIAGSRPYVYGITETSSVNGNFTLNWPSGVAVGDIALLHVVVASGQGPVLSAPTDFVGISGSSSSYNYEVAGTDNYAYIQGTGTPRIYAFKRKLDTSTPAPISLNYSALFVYGNYIAARTSTSGYAAMKTYSYSTGASQYFTQGSCNFGFNETTVMNDSYDFSFATAAYNTSGTYEVSFANPGTCTTMQGATWGNAASSTVTITVKIVRTTWDGTAGATALVKSGGSSSTLQLTSIGGISLGGAASNSVNYTGAVFTTDGNGNVTTHTITIPPGGSLGMNSDYIPKLHFAYVGGGGSPSARSGVGICEIQITWGGGVKMNGHLAVIRNAGAEAYSTATTIVSAGSNWVDTSYPSTIWPNNRLQACSKTVTTPSTNCIVSKPYALSKNSLILGIVASEYGKNFTGFTGIASNKMYGLTRTPDVGNTVTVNTEAPTSCTVYGYTANIGSNTSTGLNTTGATEYINVTQSASARSVSISYIFDNSPYDNLLAYYTAELEAQGRMPKYSSIYDGLIDLVNKMYNQRFLKVGLLAGFDDIRRCHHIDVNPYGGGRIPASRSLWSPDLRTFVGGYAINDELNPYARMRLVNFNTTPKARIDAGSLYNSNYTDYSPVYGLKGNPANRAYIAADFTNDWEGVYLTQAGTKRDYKGGSRKTTRYENYGKGEALMGTNQLRYFDSDYRSTASTRMAGFWIRPAEDSPFSTESAKKPFVAGESDICNSSYAFWYDWAARDEGVVGKPYGIDSPYKALVDNCVWMTYRQYIQLGWYCGNFVYIPHHRLLVNTGFGSRSMSAENTFYQSDVTHESNGYNNCNSGDVDFFKNRSTHVFVMGDDPFLPNYGSFRIAALYYSQRTFTNEAIPQYGNSPYDTLPGCAQNPQQAIMLFLGIVAAAYGCEASWEN